MQQWASFKEKIEKRFQATMGNQGNTNELSDDDL